MSRDERSREEQTRYMAAHVSEDLYNRIGLRVAHLRHREGRDLTMKQVHEEALELWLEKYGVESGLAVG